MTPANAAALLASYDVVLDCTDNPAARYLLSDAAVAARVPLVSGAAVATEGQLTVLCGDAAPCYRCLFRQAAAPAHCARCADAGVLGPVPGVIGTLQAVEAIKMLTGRGEPLRGRMLLYDALSARPFLCTQLPPRDASCPACGTAPDAALSAARMAEFDYAAFVAGAPAAPAPPAPAPQPPLQRVTCAAYAAAAAAGEPHLLVDVRPKHLCASLLALAAAMRFARVRASRRMTTAADAAAAPAAAAMPSRRFEAAALPGAHGIEFVSAAQFAADFAERFPAHARTGAGDGATAAPPPRVYLLCRRGNKSQARAPAAVPFCDASLTRARHARAERLGGADGGRRARRVRYYRWGDCVAPRGGRRVPSVLTRLVRFAGERVSRRCVLTKRSFATPQRRAWRAAEPCGSGEEANRCRRRLRHRPRRGHRLGAVAGARRHVGAQRGLVLRAAVACISHSAGLARTLRWELQQGRTVAMVRRMRTAWPGLKDVITASSE